MSENFWTDKYPEGMATEINPDAYPNVLAVLKESCERFANNAAFTNLGKTITYGELYELSGQFAAYLQNHTNLKPGDRIAVQMPNVLQYPVVVFGAMRAGLIVVNTNPLYTTREMEHQFNDSGAKALVCLANMASLAEEVLPKTQIETVIITEVGDMLPTLKRHLVNAVVKYVKKMVPAYHIPRAVKFTKAMALGKGKSFTEAQPEAEDIAVLQYTGGTTGVAKGAMLTHRNLLANMLQCKEVMGANLDEGEETIVAPLPLYHIYAFTVHCMVMMITGNRNLLITNPRDLPSMINDLKKESNITAFVGLNTLFVALCNNADFRALDWSKLKLTLSGGMALQKAVAERWEEVTGSPICEGYGMTETSPVVSVNPIQNIKLGTIGIPVPSTLCKIVDEDGNEQPIGEPGELCVKGPQVMKGYWQRPDDTAETIKDGWLHTGDVALIQEDGYLRIVDRMKDMIVVSGFNVYPNELEDVLSQLPEVAQCAAIGIPDERTGETIKMFVALAEGASLTEEQVIQHMRANVTGYKVPRAVEFRDELPTTNVGKILRRSLRDEELAKLGK